MTWQSSVEQTVSGLGFDLVEIERSAGGLLRVTIDVPYVSDVVDKEERFVTVEDCEVVTRQLQFLLEVEQVDYTRLEVSSPGIDRLLRHDQDCQRFLGHVVDITLKAPIGVTQSGIAANRKKFRGTLEAGAKSGSWQIVWRDEPPLKPGQRMSKKKIPAPLQAMQFVLSEVREARLAPIVNFKGRQTKMAQPASDDASSDSFIFSS